MRALLYIGILFSAVACGRKDHALQTGDLLFMAGRSGGMTEAVTAATGGEGALDFTHVGIAVTSEKGDSVLQATTEGGVRMTALAEILERAARIDARPAVVAMRLKDTTGVAKAVTRARKLLGKPYDFSFLPNNGRYYCSELVWETYRAADGSPLFEARPMNFRAADGTLPRYWIDLFSRLGEPVPEYIPGTNPNDLSREAKLKVVRTYYK